MAENNSILDRPTRLKRLRMRAWRRGIKEMDIILGGFVDKHGESFDDDTFNALETLMDRNDQQLFAWISGAIEPPADSTEPENLLIARIALAYDNV